LHNKVKHEANFLRPSHPVQYVMQRYREYMSADKASRVVTERPHTMTWIGWKPPGEGWVKINTDRACKGKVTMGCGGIIRDKRGVWLGGFAKHIGISSALTTMGCF
jgi:hypothetical protein